MKKNLILILLGFVVVLGFSLRIVSLYQNPPALSWDEISHGYNAYSILRTGSDDWGQRFPIVNFRAYGDYPLPLNLYLTIPSIVLFGLNELSIRFPHAILGSLSIIAAYLLASGLTKRKSLGLLAAFLVAIEPWTVFTSRIVLQQNVSVFLILSAGAAFFNRKKWKYLTPISFILLFLSLFAYNSTRIFSPLILVGIVFVYRKEILQFIRKGSYQAIFWAFAVLVFLLLAALIILQPSARARGQWLFILNQTAVNRIIEKRESSKLPSALTRIIYNRPTYFFSELSKNYIEYFSPEFLFFSGGTQYQYSLPGKGLSYLINLPFFYLGVFLLLKRAKEGARDYQLILVWLLLSPLPGAITNEHFAVTRVSTMLPLPQVLSAMGALWVFDYVNKKTKSMFKYILGALYFGGVILFALNYMSEYFNTYSKKYSESWQYGYKEVVGYAKENYGKYDKIIVTKKYGEPHEYFLFFWPWEPAEYKNDKNLNRFYQSNWYWVDGFDKFYFVNNWQIPTSGEKFVLESKYEVDCSKSRCLLITSPTNVPQGWSKLETVNFLDGNVAFEIYEN